MGEAGLVMIVNPVIFITVLRGLRHRLGHKNSTIKTMYFKILAIGILFEITAVLRIVLLFRQEYWKSERPSHFNVVFIFYIFFGEIGCQLILLFGILIYTRKLRAKHLRGHSLQENLML